MARGALRLVTVTLAASVIASWLPVQAQPDPLAAMNALSATPHAPAPDVAFQTLDGRGVSLAAFRGRPVLLTFFTTW